MTYIHYSLLKRQKFTIMAHLPLLRVQEKEQLPAGGKHILHDNLKVQQKVLQHEQNRQCIRKTTHGRQLSPHKTSTAFEQHLRIHFYH